MFTLARADAGRRPLAAQDFYLDELVTETARAATVLAARKNIAIEIAPPHETPFRGDEDLLRQLLLNLLDNAIKFTGDGGAIAVSVWSAERSAILAVRDTGVGIASDAVPRIFERFFRVDEARSSDAEGSGLGLTLVKWIIDRHHGTVAVESEPGKGTTVTVRLPLDG